MARNVSNVTVGTRVVPVRRDSKCSESDALMSDSLRYSVANPFASDSASGSQRICRSRLMRTLRWDGGGRRTGQLN